MRPLLGLLAASGLLSAQIPRIGVLDFYGLHRLSPEHVRKALGVSEGDRLPASKGDVEQRLEELPGVVRARLEAVCCEGDRAILYVGIEEKDAPHFEFRPPPSVEVTLPAQVVDAYQEFLRAFKDAARRGATNESAFRSRFQPLAKANLPILERVLREAADPEQRSIAAYVIGYAPLSQSIVNDLQYAMQDYDESVRANALRSLRSTAAAAAGQPELRVRVQPTWLIEMLNSIVWSDRVHAAEALVALTENRPAGVLEQIRERALGALVEMARWKTLSHALPAFILVGRVAGLPESRIHSEWTQGNREAVIKRAGHARPLQD